MSDKARKRVNAAMRQRQQARREALSSARMHNVRQHERPRFMSSSAALGGLAQLLGLR